MYEVIFESVCDSDMSAIELLLATFILKDWISKSDVTGADCCFDLEDYNDTTKKQYTWCTKKYYSTFL